MRYRRRVDRAEPVLLEAGQVDMRLHAPLVVQQFGGVSDGSFHRTGQEATGCAATPGQPRILMLDLGADRLGYRFRDRRAEDVGEPVLAEEFEGSPTQH